MAKEVLALGLLAAVATAAPLTDKNVKPGQARKGGLSLTVSLNKAVYGPGDEIRLSFKLKNETGKDLFVGDGYLAPKYHEAGPDRHFEVHITAERKSPLYFWCGELTEGTTSGIRKVFKLKPGETYEGSILLVAAAGKEGKEQGGSFEDRTTRKRHVLGKNGQRYSVALRYQINLSSHGVWEPPADFDEKLLWKGEMTTVPLEFEILSK